jgi:hypothetical protein
MKPSEKKTMRVKEDVSQDGCRAGDAGAADVRPQRLLELREHLERVSWQTYIKSKYSNKYDTKNRRSAEEERG